MTTEIIKADVREVQTKDLFGGNLIDRFIRFAGVSDKSAATYKIALRQLAKYFSANVIEKPARADLENWRDGLIADKKSPATVQLYLTSAKIFFRWLAQEGIYANIADNLKSRVKINHEHKKDALTAAQAGKLIQSVGNRKENGRRKYNRKLNELQNKRDRAILSLMTTAGLRTIEVVRADVGDIEDEFGRTYLWIQGKGYLEKNAKILLPQQVVSLIRDYLGARKEVAKNAPLFVSTANRNRGQRLSTQTISKMIKAKMRAVGIDTPRLTAHSLRHTAATTMILNDVALTQVQQVLRHVNINTTMIYNNAVERMRNTAEQIAANAIFSTIAGGVAGL